MIADKVEQLLETRPDAGAVAALQPRVSNLAPGLQSKAQTLERAIKTDHVGQLLESRPPPEALITLGVLPPPHVASNIQTARQRLERQRMRDDVLHLLETRPEVRDLRTGGILPADTRALAPSLQANARQLSFKFSRDLLGRTLQDRPDVADLAQRGILDPRAAAAATSASFAGSAAAAGGVVYEEVPDDDADPHVQRSRIAVALKAVSALSKRNAISPLERVALKDMVLRLDERVLAGVVVFELDHDVEELLDTLLRVVREP